jgi:diketogulonate reductase-like aldo/keto reductase
MTILIQTKSLEKRLGGKSTRFFKIDFIFEDLFRALEKLVKDGKVRSIGVSNYTIKHLEELLSYCEIKPAVNQVEFHPKLYQKDLLKFCNDHNIILQAYSSLAKGALLKDKLVQEIAKTYSRSASQILLRWGIQHNLVVIPKSSGPDRMKENFNLDFEISPEDMDRMDALDEDWHCTWDPTNIP